MVETVIRETAIKPRRIALVGNPNTGKTTLFNALTGLRQKVGNYSGVTVEKKLGYFKAGEHPVEIVDLPGTYSLAARSLDELVVTDLLLGKKEGEPAPELVVVIVDAGNIQRNFYLLSQILELKLPVIVALNMLDVAESKGISISAETVSAKLGIPVVPIVASRKKGIVELKQTIAESLSGTPLYPQTTPDFGNDVNKAIQSVRDHIESNSQDGPTDLSDAEIFRAIMDEGGSAQDRFQNWYGSDCVDKIKETRQELAGQLPIAALEAKTRYGWINELLEGSVTRKETQARTFSDRLDSILIHKFWGLLIFIGVMALIFQSIYSWAGPLMDLIDGFFGSMGEAVATTLPEGALRSLVVDGVIAGVGGVLIFLPQICILFLFISILEDCGYMPRAAFLMDRILSRFGLSGKSFIPMLSSFACAIPGIMATRTIEDRQDRMTTIFVAPLMSCSARLPVYIVFIGAFVPDRNLFGSWLNLQGFTLLAMYLVGILVAIPIAWLLKTFYYKSETSSFIMELPPYRIPNAMSVLIYVCDRGKAFIYRAGTIIFCVAVVIWAMAYFPRSTEVINQYETMREQRQEQFFQNAYPQLQSALPNQFTDGLNQQDVITQLEEIDSYPESVQPVIDSYVQDMQQYDLNESGELLRRSILGRMGQWVEPVVEPLGWDWRIGMAAIASFPAREVIIATLGTILNMGDEVDEESTSLKTAVQEAKRDDGTPLFSLAVALSIMVFFALCCQCAATLATIYRETNSWALPVFVFTYMTVLAWIGAFITYQLAYAIGWGA